MIIRTNIAELETIEVPMNWLDKWEGINRTNTMVYITTDKPASIMTTEELLELIEIKKEQAIVVKALTQYYEAIEILRAFGAEVESEVTGLEGIEWLKDKGE
jgi:hypothetical protein